MCDFFWCFFSDGSYQGPSKPLRQSWKDVEQTVYFLEFPSARNKLQTFFIEALSQSNPAIQKLTLPQPLNTQIDDILSYEQPVNSSTYTADTSDLNNLAQRKKFAHFL